MSIHSHTRLLIHLIFNTVRKERVILKQLRIPLSEYFNTYASNKSIKLISNYVNADHVHMLIDLAADQSIADVAKLLKGSSSRWINRQEIQQSKFSWGRGYAAFSVSESSIQSVIQYIGNQKEHHSKKSYEEELAVFLEKYNVE